MRKLVHVVLPVIVLAFSAGALTGCKNKWVKKAEEIEKAACACEDAKCAKEQAKKLNQYIKEAQGQKVKKKDNAKVAKLVSKARSCLSKAMVKDRVKKVNKAKKKDK